MAYELVASAWKTRLGDEAAKSVLALLADYANPEGCASPSMQRIADQTEIDRPDVLHIMRTFEAMGLLTLVSTADGKHYVSLQINAAMLGKDLRKAFGEAQLSVPFSITEDGAL